MKYLTTILLFLLVFIMTGTYRPDGQSFTNDVIFETKIDIGMPGAGGGLDIGEGGSYSAGVVAYKYDASAGSGSRFTALTLDATNTWLGDVGDRFYVGAPQKFWGLRLNMTQAKSSEVIRVHYWNGDIDSSDHMGILKTTAASSGQAVFEQTAQKEYIVWDHRMDADWVAVDNKVDSIPNTGGNLFWIWIQVPSGGLATPLITDEIKVRGTDYDFITGASFPVYWGQARVERHTNISLAVVKSPGGTTTADINITSNHQARVFDFNGSGDQLSFSWILPSNVDLSSGITVDIAYSANAAISTCDILLSCLKVKNNTVIGSGVSPDFTETTNIEVVASDRIYLTQSLTVTSISIQDLNADDGMSFELQRTDANGNSFYPIFVTIHYTIWTTGEHV